MKTVSILFVLFTVGQAHAAPIKSSTPLALLRLQEDKASVTYRLLPGKTDREALLERIAEGKTKRTRIGAGLARKIQSDLTVLSWQIKYGKGEKPVRTCSANATIEVGIHERATACAESAGVRQLATQLNRLI